MEKNVSATSQEQTFQFGTATGTFLKNLPFSPSPFRYTGNREKHQGARGPRGRFLVETTRAVIPTGAIARRAIGKVSDLLFAGFQAKSCRWTNLAVSHAE
jgi:hypothetical protein